nr:MAG TPA: hypothetical protein [Caudoviricetes sp.]
MCLTYSPVSRGAVALVSLTSLRMALSTSVRILLCTSALYSSSAPVIALSRVEMVTVSSRMPSPHHDLKAAVARLVGALDNVAFAFVFDKSLAVIVAPVGQPELHRRVQANGRRLVVLGARDTFAPAKHLVLADVVAALVNGDQSDYIIVHTTPSFAGVSNLDTPACCALALHLLMAEPIVDFCSQVARHCHGRLLPALVQVRGVHLQQQLVGLITQVEDDALRPQHLGRGCDQSRKVLVALGVCHAEISLEQRKHRLGRAGVRH